MIERASKLWVKDLRYRWSSIRHHSSPKAVSWVLGRYLEEHSLIPKTIGDIKKSAEALMLNFDYTNDGVDRLYDSIDTPASCLERAFLKAEPLMDDCDGFHSALYGLVDYNFNCRLLTLVTRKIEASHTLLIVSHPTEYGYVCFDYTYVSDILLNINAVVADAQRRLYTGVTDIIYSELSKWDGDRWKSKGF